MTPEALSAAASLLYGEQWQRPLARRLEVDSRLVRRWKAGDRPIPAWVEPRLFELLKERQEEIDLFLNK